MSMRDIKVDSWILNLIKGGIFFTLWNIDDFFKNAYSELRLLDDIFQRNYFNRAFASYRNRVTSLNFAFVRSS